MATATSDHRRRFLIGLAVALLAGVGIGLALLNRARTTELNFRQQREAVVTLRALTDLVERAGGGAAAPAATLAAAPAEADSSAGGGMGLGQELAAVEAGTAAQTTTDPGGPVRTAVERFAAAHPDIKSIRVITFEGLLLEASSAPADTGIKAAPRKLERDEKPLYDLGQKLRAAISENRENTAQGQAAVGEELALQRLPDGSLVLAGPVEHPTSDGGEVVGMVQIQTAAPPVTSALATPWGPALLAWLAPVILFFLLSLALGQRRALLAVAASVLLLAGLIGFGRYALQSLEAGRRETGKALAASMTDETAKTSSLLAGLPKAAPLDASRWDADLFRHPRGLVTAAGTVAEKGLDAEIHGDAVRLYRSIVLLALLSLVLLAFVGFGGAARVGHDLVEYRQAYAYTMPAMIAMLLLVFFPFFYGVALSFTNDNIYNSSKPITEIWVGLSNFKDILSDVSIFHRGANGAIDYHNFYWTLGFTIVWTISNIAIGVSLGLILALVLNIKGLAFRAYYRVLLILPWAMPNYITSLIFKGMFHQQFGVINQIRQMVGLAPIAWFNGPFTSFLAVLTTNGWLSFPFMMVVSLGALQSIPADLYEAARVDGATRWQQFKSITLPSLKPALVPAIILSVIWTFNQFNVIYLVSAGEPSGATEILITQSYKLAFEQYRYGYAAAYSMIIFLILLVYGTWQNRVTKATEGV
ncbi:MAG TPA: sugar ABC transporter permease [Thermoanaerobaculia bacterium]|jgi:arabinogalactan oligomer/maltooligosaccharide transport system permease protein|nr:sugar ABC transporter permease [Thermoanaerobaculia bacterium]